MPEWNLADLVEAIAARRAGSPMIVDDERVLTWDDVDRRADAFAAHLLAAGLGHQDRVGVCARNSAACLEAYLACAKAGLVPFNINFRYGADEIAYLLDNADARAVVYHREFGASVEPASARAGGVRTLVRIADDSGEPDIAGAPASADDYETVVATAGPRAVAPWGRSPDDLVFIYTGGTTGMPKAVMWRQGDLVTLLAGSDTPPGHEAVGADDDIVGRLAAVPRRSCSAAPFIHGTGLLSQLANFMTGGTAVILEGRRFDPEAVWAGVERHRVNVLVIVGDPFARPLLDALDRSPDRHDLSSLAMITTSGAMCSRHVKEGLLRRLPQVAILDAFGSSEASGLGVSMATADDLDATAVFRVGDRVKVLGDDGRLLGPGASEPGRIALTGPMPVGYHKDPARTADAFPVIDGVRYSVPGDYVLLADDGRLTLLGRGSSVINSGGEKVYAEEVEEMLKEHPGVVDVAVLGVPDATFGQAVCAVVQPAPGAVPTLDALRDEVRGRAAAYKAPRRLVLVEDLGRLPNGKLDRAALAELAAAAPPPSSPTVIGRAAGRATARR